MNDQMNTQKKPFVPPTAETILLSGADIITTSGGGGFEGELDIF